MVERLRGHWLWSVTAADASYLVSYWPAWSVRVGASLLTEGIDRGVEGGEEVIRIKGADEFVALELRSDGSLSSANTREKPWR